MNKSRTQGRLLENLEIHRQLFIFTFTVAPSVAPRPAWLGWLGVVPPSERSAAGFLARARAWVAGLVPGWGVRRSHRCFFPSPPSFLPSSLSKNK